MIFHHLRRNRWVKREKNTGNLPAKGPTRVCFLTVSFFFFKIYVLIDFFLCELWLMIVARHKNDDFDKRLMESLIYRQMREQQIKQCRLQLQFACFPNLGKLHPQNSESFLKIIHCWTFYRNIFFFKFSKALIWLSKMMICGIMHVRMLLNAELTFTESNAKVTNNTHRLVCFFVYLVCLFVWIFLFVCFFVHSGSSSNVPQHHQTSHFNVFVKIMIYYFSLIYLN